jgi:hypothetical protein
MTFFPGTAQADIKGKRRFQEDNTLVLLGSTVSLAVHHDDATCCSNM